MAENLVSKTGVPHLYDVAFTAGPQTPLLKITTQPFALRHFIHTPLQVTRRTPSSPLPHSTHHLTGRTGTDYLSFTSTCYEARALNLQASPLKVVLEAPWL
jgi:hypothetical protein